MALKSRTVTINGKKQNQRWIDGKGWVNSYGAQPWAAVTPSRIASNIKTSLSGKNKSKDKPGPGAAKASTLPKNKNRNKLNVRFDTGLKIASGSSKSKAKSSDTKTKSKPKADGGNAAEIARLKKKIARGGMSMQRGQLKSTLEKRIRKLEKANTGSGRKGSPGKGTYGKSLPSNPQLKTQKTKDKKKKPELFKGLSKMFDN
tara:strand:+ start:1489 stop:2094 length:606 start_codon:yes stop_codon:yes gene_type:complete